MPGPPVWGPPPSGPPPYQPAWAPPPAPAPSPRRTNGPLVAGGIVLGIVVVAGVVAAGIAVGTATGPNDDFGVEVGQCFTGDVAPAHVVDCENAHDAEAYVVEAFRDIGGDYPGTGPLLSEASDTCLDEFEGYVGVGFLRSRFSFEAVVPTAEEWDDGVREFVCTLVDVSGEPTEGAGRGSGE